MKGKWQDRRRAWSRLPAGSNQLRRCVERIDHDLVEAQVDTRTRRLCFLSVTTVGKARLSPGINTDPGMLNNVGGRQGSSRLAALETAGVIVSDEQELPLDP